MRPMAEGLMERYRTADEAPPKLMYVDRGCCHIHGVSSVEQLFSEWTDRGMLVRLNIFHWIHRFDAALRTDHHPKYSLFKSALSAAVFAYNKDDVALLVQAIRASHSMSYASLTDSQPIELHVSKSDLSHHVRRITVGTQETYARVQSAIDILKGAAGMDENQVHLFKDAAAIDHVWENQQKHLECIQDPPGRNMYTITKYVTRNGVRLPRYSTVRGSNSLEGFHSFLPNMIPGPHCAAVPFQVYLLAGIARWNSDRESASVKGQKGRKHMVYISPLVHRLNQRCQELFGEVEEANYRPGSGGKVIGSPVKHQITKMYQRVQQRVTVDDAELRKLGIPILKINSKCVSEFIRRQEASSATNVTDQGLVVLRRHQSVSSTSQPPAIELPDERPHTSRPTVQY